MKISVLATISTITASVLAAPVDQTNEEPVVYNVDFKKSYLWKTDGDVTVATAPTQPNITYNGGSLILGPIHLNFILYGSHPPSVAENFKTFAQSLGTSDYWGVERTYYQPINGTDVKISGRVGFHNIWYDNYSLGKDISDPQAIPTIITNAIKAHGKEEDPNAIYTIYMSPDVTDGGFCTGGYCGYHTAFQSPITNNILFYSLIGDPTVCPGSLPPPGQPRGVPGCLPRPWRNTTDSINHDQHADGPMSAIAHEILESASDPFGDAWYDEDGEENGDKCNGNWLTLQYDEETQIPYNLEFGDRKYLIQSNWDVISQECSLGRNQHERN